MRTIELLKQILDAIRELLGHTELSTTLSHIYHPLPEKDTYELISKAL